MAIDGRRAAAAALAALLAACSSHSTSGPPQCAGAMEACQADPGCCSNACLAGFCMGSSTGGACGTSDDCVAPLLCKSYVCAAAACRDDGDVCTADAQCCAASCTVAGRCAPNSAPVVSMGGDRSAPKRALVTIDARPSRDADGDALTFTWSLAAPGGSTAAIAAQPGQPAVASFTTDAVGAYRITLVLRDSAGHATTGTVTVTVANTPPVAVAGADQTVSRNVAVALDATGSTDVDRDPLSFSWTLERPAGSAAVLAGESTATPVFTPDVQGLFRASVAVSDGTATATATVALTAVNDAPAAALAYPLQVNAGDAVALDASGSSDRNGDALTFSWTLDRPAGSGAGLDAPGAAAPGFTTDVEGPYVLHLVVSDGQATARADRTVTALRHVWRRPHDVVDAAYDRAHDRILVAAGAPAAALWVLDPGAETAAQIALGGGPPLAVGVSPDGLVAAVARGGAVDVVNLSTGAVSSCALSWNDGSGPLPFGAGSVAIGNPVQVGHGQGTPTRFAWLVAGDGSPGDVLSVDVTSCALGQQSYPGLLQAGKGRVRPGDGRLYVANGPYGSEYQVYSATGAASWSATCSVWSTVADFWFYDDGSRLLEGTGVAYLPDPVVPVNGPAFAWLDVAGYLGADPATRADRIPVLHADHSSAAGALAVIVRGTYGQAPPDGVVRLFDPVTLAERPGGHVLPLLTLSGAGQAAHGRFVFHSADGARRYVLLHAGTPASWAVAAFP